MRLIHTPGLGPRRIARLIAQFGSAETAVAAAPRGWAHAGLEPGRSGEPPAADAQGVEQDLRWLEAPAHHLVCLGEDDYPPLLAPLDGAPAALFVAGDPALLWHAQVAVVGSRNPTAGGRDNAADFAGELARAGLVVTSGLAAGIDAAAHAAALDAGGATIAVMGTGPDQVYPAANRRLAARIAAEGALVSEYPTGTGVRREHFPQRNRIVVGLSLGTLVVEAALQSGALISARLAAEAGREVFALPGSIHNPLARGCHRLLREGATLVESAQEILTAVAGPARELGQKLRQRLDSAGPDPAKPPASILDPAYQRLMEALGHDPVPMERLVERTGLTVDALSSMLLVLELEGRVAAIHGRYARSGS
nr:DNA-processing protein DprA [Lysobacter sp. CAU 1642]